MSFFGVQSGQQLGRHGGNAGDGEFTTVSVQNLDKAAHMSTFVLVRKIHSHVHRGDGVLGHLVAITNAERKADIFDTNAINSDLAVIAFILRIFKRGHGGNKNSHCRSEQQWEG